jgi:hypothetical protein
METAAGVLLALLAVIVLLNLANGTLTAWLKAKFLHQAPPTPKPAGT